MTLLRTPLNLYPPLLPAFRRPPRRRCPPPPPLRCSLPDLVQSLGSSLPALAFGSGAALFLSSQRRSAAAAAAADAVAGSVGGVAGDLYTSATPFNRSVLLRCPSVSLSDAGDRHSVSFSGGGRREPSGMEYQRVCVGAEDGGVVSLDWPEGLDLEKECGSDTTVLIVPGTVEGSMDADVRAFVSELLRSGCFPVVVNPRGCAGSPVTTPRLFTAADSDDICTAIKFVNNLRPWTTLISIGWGYGANMLTKYLAEAGATTPLTAAVCIDNPFDLDEATRSFTNYTAFNQKLRSGLIDVLRANKELFQGKAKGFNVAKALSANSIRDFDEAISMISYGCNNIGDFYSKISTKQSVSSVKIPVLFIQSGDITVPPLSIPRSSIAENPFTSLLLCSCLPSTISGSDRSAISWFQDISIEWLSAVELALLKGRHPLLKDVDITINASKGLTYTDGIASERSISPETKAHGSVKPGQLYNGNKNIRGDAYTKFTQSNSSNGFLIDSPANMNDDAIQNKFHLQSKPGNALREAQREEEVATKQDGKGDVSRESDEGDSSSDQGGGIPIDSEGSQVFQTASVVMNMLDVTMPGALQEEQKKKVLTAMEHGDTLMKALEGAVPVEVRGKLRTAATEILQTQGTKLNLDGLKRIGWIPNVTSEVTSRIREKLKGVSARESRHEANQRTGAGTDGGTQDGSVLIGDSSTGESIVSSQEKAVQVSQSLGAKSEEEIKQIQDTKFEKSGNDGEEGNGQEYKDNQSNEMTTKPPVSDQVLNDVNDVQRNEENKIDSVAEQNTPASYPNSDEKVPADEDVSAVSSTNDQPLVENEGTEVPKKDDKTMQDTADQNLGSSSPKLEEPQGDRQAPSINVTQALGAITGFDDSTQMAVNSVFGVLENMIDEFEKASNRGTDEESDKEDQDSVDASDELPPISEDKSEKTLNGNNKIIVESDVIHTLDQKETSFQNNSSDSHGKTDDNRDRNQERKVGRNLPSSENYSISRAQENLPLEVAVNPNWESPYGAYLRRYLSTQMPINGSFDLNSTTDLFLDPEEGQWKMLNQAGNTESGEKQKPDFLSRQDGEEKVIEPSYVIIDSEYSGPENQLNEESATVDYSVREQDAKKERLSCLIRISLLDSLKIEIGRKLGMLDLGELESDLVYDMEHVSDTVSQAVVHGTELNLNLLPKHDEISSINLGIVDGESILRTVSSAMQEASHLRKVLPVGVVVGTCLASLRNYFEVVALRDGNRSKAIAKQGKMQDTFSDQEGHLKGEGHRAGTVNICEDNRRNGTKSLNNDGVMVGAVTAALGASVLLANHQHGKSYEHENTGTSSDSYDVKDYAQTEQEEMQERNQTSLVGSLAEKALSVAAPVVPTKSGGGVDQERLVAILAELGQKGGVLKLVGKLALLWGGVRGAMSLTERLISFLHLDERSLFQRILGFVCMVLVLWSPVLIPLLPTLVQSWTTNTSNGIAQPAMQAGLYVAIVFLVMLWGKRVRGYDNPMEQYGLDFRSATRVREFTMGLAGGAMIVMCIHSVNALFGFARLSWPPSLTSSSAGLLLKACGSLVGQAVRGIVQAISIAIVEELLFRSWLTEEAAVDLGYYRAVMLSGILFSLVQRSLPSIPAFLLLSLALFGIKQRMSNKLSAIIGVRTGIMSTHFFLRSADFLTYPSGTPFWLSSIHLWHPFDGAVGLGVSAIMAILFYPRPPSSEQHLKKS